MTIWEHNWTSRTHERYKGAEEDWAFKWGTARFINNASRIVNIWWFGALPKILKSLYWILYLHFFA